MLLRLSYDTKSKQQIRNNNNNAWDEHGCNAEADSIVEAQQDKETASDVQSKHGSKPSKTLSNNRREELKHLFALEDKSSQLLTHEEMEETKIVSRV